MGVNTSVQNVDSLTEVVNNTLTQVSADVVNTSSSDLSSNQKMYLKLKDIKNCTLNIVQEADMAASNILESKSNIASKLENAIKNTIEKQIESATKQTNEDLNIGQLNTSVQQTNSKTKTINNLKNIIEMGIENSVTTKQDGSQTMTLDAENVECGSNGMFNIKQNMVMEAVSKNIAENIVNTAIKNSLTNDIKEKLVTNSTQENKGIDVMMMWTILIVVAVIGFGGFAYLRTGGISRAAEKKINEFDINKHANTALQQKRAFGGKKGRRKKGNREKNDDILKLKLKLGVLCAGIVGVYYKYKYLPDKQKVKDKYDIEYLNK